MTNDPAAALSVKREKWETGRSCMETADFLANFIGLWHNKKTYSVNIA